jgi:hypothetical protein
MADGLDQLSDMREKRKTRSVPPPRHAARATPVEIPAGPPIVVEAASEPPSDLPVPKTPDVAQPPAHETPEPAASPDLELLTKYSIYFDQDNDDFLEAVRVAGRRAKPKLDASRSAVARLALARLAETLTAEEVLAELRSRAPRQDDKIGRKRY